MFAALCMKLFVAHIAKNAGIVERVMLQGFFPPA